MIKDKLKESVMELLAEDYYGVWELYWSYRELAGGKQVDDELFIAVLEELVATNKIEAYNQIKFPGEFERTILDVGRLRSELRKVKTDNIVKDMYWFGDVRPETD